MRCLNPEMCEDRELLARGLGRIDRESARRQPVDLVPCDRAKIAGTLEDQEFVPEFAGIDMRADAKAGKGNGRIGRWRGDRGAQHEHRVRGDQVPRIAVLDDRYGDRRIEIEPDGQQLHPERQGLVPPDVVLRVETDAAILIGAEFFEPAGYIVALSRIGRGCALLRLIQHRLERKRIARGHPDFRQGRYREQQCAQISTHRISRPTMMNRAGRVNAQTPRQGLLV